MSEQLTTRWIRLQRDAVRAAQQMSDDAVTPFGADDVAAQASTSAPDAQASSTTEALVFGVWQAFFANFREDERAFELPHYQAAGLMVTDRIEQFGVEKGLDAQTVHLMLVLLRQFSDARFRDIDERINDLVTTCQQLRAQLDVSELSKCYQEDELNSCQRLVRQAMKHLNLPSTTSDDISRPSAELRLVLAALGREGTTRTTATPPAQTPLGVPMVGGSGAGTGTAEIIDVHERDSLHWTKLHSAAFVGKVEVVNLLLEKGAEVNARAKDGATPLHLAVKRGHVSVAKLLFTKGANLTAKDTEGNTPVHLASELYTIDMVKALISMGVMVNQKNESGWTPLHLAANKGKIEVVETLIAAGADINAVAGNGWTPLAVAANCGHLQLTTHLRNQGARQ
jgi:Ankyrin repeats (3 copies)/Ankyrin repeat